MRKLQKRNVLGCSCGVRVHQEFLEQTDHQGRKTLTVTERDVDLFARKMPRAAAAAQRTSEILNQGRVARRVLVMYRPDAGQISLQTSRPPAPRLGGCFFSPRIGM